MPTTASVSSPFHSGEQAVQSRLGVRDGIDPWASKVVRPFLTAEHQAFFSALPFIVVAARDERARPWATIVAGRPGFADSPDPTTLQIRSEPVQGDALAGAIAPGSDVGLLGIELETRRRNRVNGRVRSRSRGEMVLEVDQGFGNCPQYISQRAWRFEEEPRGDGGAGVRHDRLTPDLAARIRAADTCFIATGHRGAGEDPRFGMDASHRGGAPGFIEVADERSLLIPDYAGNNHFNTLGNLELDPRAGLLFVDFETGGLLQLTGRTEIDWGSDAISRFPGARRLIRFALDEGVDPAGVLPLRWSKPVGAARALRLVEKTRETDDVTSFTFAAHDGEALAEFAAGQYLPIALQLPDRRGPVERTYSLSNAPSRDHYRISVKRESRGLASRHLHDGLDVGAIVSAGVPTGDFVLDHGRGPVVLLSAGIGVTPMVSMLHELVEHHAGRAVWFVHGTRDGRHHALRSEVERVVAGRGGVRVHVAYSRPLPEDRLGRDHHTAGRVDAALLDSIDPPPDADYYLCGPLAFMSATQAVLEVRGVARDRIHSESFGPTG